MALRVNHAKVVTTPDSGDGKVSTTAWNDAHTVTGTPGTVLGFDADGVGTEISVGTAAAKNTGTSGNTVPLLDGVNTWSAFQTISVTDTGANAFNVKVNTGHVDGLRTRFAIENNAAQALVDINIRGAVLNVGSTDSSISAAATQIAMFSPAGDTSSAFSIFQPGSSTAASLQFGRGGTITSYCYGLAGTFIQFGSWGAANPVLKITEDNGGGTLWWGAGGASAVDTNLYRSAADTLKTDDSFIAVGTVSGSNLTTGGLPASIATGTIIGRSTAGTGAASALTATQTKTLLAIANTDVSGLGTASTVNTGTAGHTVPFLDGTNAWSTPQSIANTFLYFKDGTASTTGAIYGSGGYLIADTDNFLWRSGAGTLRGTFDASGFAAVGTVTGSNLSGTNTGDGAYTIQTKIAGYTATETAGDIIVKADLAAGFTIVLPTAVSNKARFTFKKIQSAGAIVIDGNASETIDGGLTATLNNQNESITICSDNANWIIV